MKKSLFLIVMMMWSCGVLHGQETWVKTFGGSELEDGNSITTTPDGGYGLMGTTHSNDGDFEGLNKGERDIFAMKLDSRGDVLWTKVFGGREIELGFSITTTPDGGYVLTGETYSNDGDFEGMNKGYTDFFVIKLDSHGDIQWKKVLGGRGNETGFSIATTPDAGYVLTGETQSNDGDFKGMNNGYTDFFVIKLDSHGNVQWKKTFGGSEWDWGRSITKTPDGGYVLTGSTNSIDNDFNGMNKGMDDIFVIKLDSRGNVEWKKTFGGSEWDWGRSITKTSDGSYVLTGWTESNDGDFKGTNKGRKDIFVIKLDSNGNLQSTGKKSKKK